MTGPLPGKNGLRSCACVKSSGGNSRTRRAQAVLDEALGLSIYHKTSPSQQFVARFKNRFGARPHSKVVSQVFPENCALRIHEKFSGTRDVLAIHAGFGMQ